MSKPDWSWLKPQAAALPVAAPAKAAAAGPPSHQNGPRTPRNKWDVLPKEDLEYYLSLSRRKD